MPSSGRANGTGLTAARPSVAVAKCSKPEPCHGPRCRYTCYLVGSAMLALHAAPVAQRIESRTSNPKVVGSNPTGRALLATADDDSGSHQESLAHAPSTSQLWARNKPRTYTANGNA